MVGNIEKAHVAMSLTDRNPTSRIPEKPAYHHGDLQRSLLDAARKMIREGGVEALSLRKLAEKVGVSRTAAYHYFTDKNALLCHLAEQGFYAWRDQAETLFADRSLDPVAQFRAYIHWYMGYAIEHAEIYDLMFGRAIWKQEKASESLKAVAYATFQLQVEMTRRWQAHGILSPREDSLRVAQVSWGALHGLARLMIDGIYRGDSPVEDMCACAATLLMQHKS